MIDFRSDTVTRPTAAMRDAMHRAPLGDDVFGDDPTVNGLQRHAAEMLGFEAALFAPSGTQTNLIALMSQCQRGDEAIVGQQWHSYRWEGGGMAVLGSIQPQPIENGPDGTLALDAIAAAIKPDDPHFARTRLIALENTTGGRVLPLTYLQAVGALARQHGLALHLDGARLFNAAVATAAADHGERPSHETIIATARAICEPFDTVSLCLSKGLGAPVGSLLLGSEATIGRARRVRKMLGGGMRQAGVLAAAGAYALEHHVARIADDHANAARLADGLRTLAAGSGRLAGRLGVVAPDSNIVFVDVATDVAPALATHLAAAGIGVTGGLYGGAYRQRWVTHLDVDSDDVETALAALRAFDRGSAAAPGPAAGQPSG